MLNMLKIEFWETLAEHKNESLRSRRDRSGDGVPADPDPDPLDRSVWTWDPVSSTVESLDFPVYSVAQT